MNKSEKPGFFNTLFKLLAKFDALFVSGFLGQLPTDIRSKIYTNWLRLAGAKIGKGSVIHHKVKIWNPENIIIGKGLRIPATNNLDISAIESIEEVLNDFLGSILVVSHDTEFLENIGVSTCYNIVDKRLKRINARLSDRESFEAEIRQR